MKRRLWRRPYVLCYDFFSIDIIDHMVESFDFRFGMSECDNRVCGYLGIRNLTIAQFGRQPPRFCLVPDGHSCANS